MNVADIRAALGLHAQECPTAHRLLASLPADGLRARCQRIGWHQHTETDLAEIETHIDALTAERDAALARAEVAEALVVTFRGITLASPTHRVHREHAVEHPEHRDRCGLCLARSDCLVRSLLADTAAAAQATEARIRAEEAGRWRQKLTDLYWYCLMVEQNGPDGSDLDGIVYDDGRAVLAWVESILDPAPEADHE